MSAMGVVFFLFPYALLRAFTSDEAVDRVGHAVSENRGPPADSPRLHHGGGRLPCGGAGDTRFVMIATMIGMWGAHPLAIMAGYWLSMGVFYVWLAMIADWTLRMALMLWRHRSERWRSIQVLRSSPT